MRGVQIQKVYDVAAKIDKAYHDRYVKTGDERRRLNKFNRIVMIVTDDGSSFYYNNAYVETYNNEDGMWYIIFPEYHDTMVIHSDDVILISQYPRQMSIQTLRM